MKKTVFCLLVLLSLGAGARAQGASKLPDAIAVPNGTIVASFQASGAQIYGCAKNAAGALEWVFREPIATLVQDGKTMGRHFAGPTWEFVNGTHVVGKAAAQAPGKHAADIPWLKLAVAEPPSSGPAAGATFVQRIDTKGGVLKGACTKEGALRAQPYAATYVFVK